jgi:hypothetical protein
MTPNVESNAPKMAIGLCVFFLQFIPRFVHFPLIWGDSFRRLTLAEWRLSSTRKIYMQVG